MDPSVNEWGIGYIQWLIFLSHSPWPEGLKCYAVPFVLQSVLHFLSPPWESGPVLSINCISHRLSVGHFNSLILQVWMLNFFHFLINLREMSAKELWPLFACPLIRGKTRLRGQDWDLVYANREPLKTFPLTTGQTKHIVNQTSAGAWCGAACGPASRNNTYSCDSTRYLIEEWRERRRSTYI